MRLFIGWPLPDHAKGAIESALAPLRSSLPAASWPRSETLHLTFLFLGERPPEESQELTRRLASLGEFPPFEVRSAAPGFFPSDRRPRVAWLGLEPEGRIAELAAEVRNAAGEEPEERPFKPHLTLARIRGSWRHQETERFRAAVGRVSFDASLDRVLLYESRLSSGGAKHLPLSEVRLRG